MSSPLSSSVRSSQSAAISWSPPMPMWRWMRQIGSTISCWRKARYQATAWWKFVSTNVPSMSRMAAGGIRHSYPRRLRLNIAALAAVLIVLLVPASAAAACRGAGATTRTATTSTLVHATLCILNAKRAGHGLRPLRLNAKLGTAARRHSRAMVRRRFFSHTSPNGDTFLDRIRATGYLEGAQSWSVGENIAYGSGSRSTPRSIGRAWRNSRGHRANILHRSCRDIGIGIASRTPAGTGGATYTTDFGRRD